jgi:hypothetical protein
LATARALAAGSALAARVAISTITGLAAVAAIASVAAGSAARAKPSIAAIYNQAGQLGISYRKRIQRLIVAISAADARLTETPWSRPDRAAGRAAISGLTVAARARARLAALAALTAAAACSW